MTYAEHAAATERAGRKAAQDRHLLALQRRFDLSAQDTHVKSERPSFVVVTASAAFREGWDRLFGRA